MIPITVFNDSHNCLQWFPQLSSFAEILPRRHSWWGLPTSCRLTTAPSPSPWPRIIWKCRVKPAAAEAIIEPLSGTPAILCLVFRHESEMDSSRQQQTVGQNRRICDGAIQYFRKLEIWRSAENWTRKNDVQKEKEMDLVIGDWFSGLSLNLGKH